MFGFWTTNCNSIDCTSLCKLQIKFSLRVWFLWVYQAAWVIKLENAKSTGQQWGCRLRVLFPCKNPQGQRLWQFRATASTNLQERAELGRHGEWLQKVCFHEDTDQKFTVAGTLGQVSVSVYVCVGVMVIGQRSCAWYLTPPQASS